MYSPRFRKCSRCNGMCSKHNDFTLDEWLCNKCFGYEKVSDSSNVYSVPCRPTSGICTNILFLDYYEHLVTYSFFTVRHLSASSGETWPPSSDWLMQEMECEWKKENGSRHWAYVMGNVPYAANSAIDGRKRDEGHEGFSLNDFLNLSISKAAKLVLPEIVALRLYTGPGINLIFQKSSLGFLTRRCFDVTVYCINAAIGKLGLSSSPPSILLRGLQGSLPTHAFSCAESYQGKDDGNGTDKCKSNAVFLTELTVMSSVNAATSSIKGDCLLAMHTNIPKEKSNTIESKKLTQIIQAFGQELNPIEAISKPAPINWIAQVPFTEEWLWPLGTAMLVLPSSLHKIKEKDRHVLEVVPFYLWNSQLNCPALFEVPWREKQLLQTGLSKLDIEALQQFLESASLNAYKRLLLHCDEGNGHISKARLVLLLEKVPSSYLMGDIPKANLLRLLNDHLSKSVNFDDIRSVYQ